MARLPSGICEQQPPEVHTRPPLTRHNAPLLGAPLQQPLSGSIMEREGNETPSVRQASHHVNRQCQSDLHAE
jgi:hypothetical protein